MEKFDSLIQALIEAVSAYALLVSPQDRLDDTSKHRATCVHHASSDILYGGANQTVINESWEGYVWVEHH